VVDSLGDDGCGRQLDDLPPHGFIHEHPAQDIAWLNDRHGAKRSFSADH
jgi:hypothetical protein